ncbi:MAG: hypothetical protein KDB23_11885 [Planctomycetales bacterium]|nr:hypothetical protein [Planctomycetales bacterium]
MLSSRAVAESLVETFDGNGSYTAGPLIGLDNPGWAYAGDVYLAGGAMISRNNGTADTPQSFDRDAIHRNFSGASGFRSELTLASVELGDYDSSHWYPEEHSPFALIDFQHDLNVAMATTSDVRLIIYELPSTTDDHWTLVARHHQKEYVRTDVPRGQTVTLALEFQSDPAQVIFAYATEEVRLTLGPFPYDGPVSNEKNVDLLIGAYLSGDANANIIEYQLYSTPELRGDFSGNGELDVADLTLLVEAIARNDSAFDLTADSHVDLNDLGIWIRELKHTYHGDSDLDGEFNSADLINVFQAGQYEDDIASNSTWSTGDWNGDGEFTSSDLVLAFQDGGYEQGPREAVLSVPEPSGILSVVFGGLLSLIARSSRR